MKSLPLAASLLVLFVFFALTFLARSIQDPDFFWHLKVGEWLWQHHSWPIPDPFAFTTPAELDQRQLFIIKGYWLSQLLYFACHAVLGWTGIFFLRLAVFAAFVWIMWKNRQGDSWLWGGFSLICLAGIFNLYPVDRPQFFSFLLFAWLCLLLDRLWSGAEPLARRHYWAVGTGMLLWGNLHGGVLLGQLLLLITLAICLVNILRKKQVQAVGESKLSVMAGVGLLAGFLNPNVFRFAHVFSQVADTSALMYASTEEYASVIAAWQGGGRPVAVLFAAVAVLAAVALFYGFRKQTLFSLLVLAGTSFYAARHIRYIPFFLLAALPVLVKGFSDAPFVRQLRILVIAGALVFAVCLAWDERGNLGRIKSEGWVSNEDFPAQIAEQVLSKGIEGRLFNLYRWGGYLLWRLGPERQVFVDGRALDARIVKDALTAEMVSIGGGRLVWKEIFARHGINYAILPVVEGGRPYPLTYAVAQDAEWQAACTFDNAVLLVKR